MRVHRFIQLSIVGVAIAFNVYASSSQSAVTQEISRMHANGEFDVKTTPQKADNADAEAAGFARIALNKRYHGALDATAQGEMLASGDGNTAGAYVALEKVTGTLDGRKGSFVLLHSAVMVGGVPRNWSVTVVPASGTGQLKGLEGELRITMADGKHAYAFDYHLPD